MFFRSIRRNFTEVLVNLSKEKNGVRLITLQHSSKKNALSGLFINQLRNHLEAIQQDAEARSVIIKSAVEGIFCAGADLKERLKMSSSEVESFVWLLRDTFSMIEEISVPTLACIEGFALGGGLEMALACDLRVASPNAKVGLVETKIAVIPGAGGTFRLPRLIGLQRAKEMVFTAAVYNAEKAKEYGILADVVQDPLAKCFEITDAIATKGPVAIKMAKKAIDLAYGKDKNTGLHIEGLCYAGVVNTEDRIEALNAFAEKRNPVFKGK